MEFILRVMPLPRYISDAFGAVTISLVFILVLLSLFCIIYTIYFQLQIIQQGHLHLGYFNGPCLIRIVFVLVTIWWGFGEVIRLRFLNLSWKEKICKVYIISNIGFAEPTLALILLFLLQASLQERTKGVLRHQWSLKTMACVFLLCFPIFLLQIFLVVFGHKFFVMKDKMQEKELNKYLTDIYSSITCLYPLMNTMLLGIFHGILICYLSCIGIQMVTTVINKRSERRISILVLSVIILLPSRVVLLGFSVLPSTGGLQQELLVFIAFLALLSWVLLCMWMLVYRPIVDSLVLRDLEKSNVDVEEELMTVTSIATNIASVDDYNNGTSSQMGNQGYLETSRSSDASSTKHGSISFRTMIRPDLQLPISVSSDRFDDGISFTPNNVSSLHVSPYTPRSSLDRVPECSFISQ